MTEPTPEALATATEFCNACPELPKGAADIVAKLLDLFTEQRVAAAVAQERERCAQVLLNGRFLHDKAPPALFAKEAVGEARDDPGR